MKKILFLVLLFLMIKESRAQEVSVGPFRGSDGIKKEVAYLDGFPYRNCDQAKLMPVLKSDQVMVSGYGYDIGFTIFIFSQEDSVWEKTVVLNYLPAFIKKTEGGAYILKTKESWFQVMTNSLSRKWFLRPI